MPVYQDAWDWLLCASHRNTQLTEYNSWHSMRKVKETVVAPSMKSAQKPWLLPAAETGMGRRSGLQSWGVVEAALIRPAPNHLSMAVCWLSGRSRHANPMGVHYSAYF